MLILTVDEALEKLDARVLGSSSPDRSSRFPSVSIDTRTIRPGEAFVAIQGPRFDGHQFLAEALKKGASCLICARRPEQKILEQSMTILVQDTTCALQKLGAASRQKWAGPLIAVTGSMGKTTTRSFAGTLLRERFTVLETKGNLNNEFGVPLSLLNLQDEHQVALLELGMNRAGEIQELARICQPTAAVLTNVSEVHLEFFESVDAIAEAKGEIIPELPEDGWLVYNRDDHRVSWLARRFSGQTISFGFHTESDCIIREYRIERADRMSFTLEYGDELYQTSIAMAGRHVLYNLAAATAVARKAGVLPDQILAGYKRLRPGPMRGEILSIGEVTIWDESYNSNPRAVFSLLETVASLEGYTRKWMALGDMLELGSRSAELHRELGHQVVNSNVDFLVTVGEHARFIQEGALEAGLPKRQLLHFVDSEKAGESLSERLRSGDLLVIKGSRGVKMDRILEWLKGVRA